MIVFRAMVEQAKLHEQMKKVREDMDVLKRCGLDKEAKALLPKYNGMVERMRRLEDETHEQQRKSAQALLVCFVAADLATLAADRFAEVCREVNFGMNDADNSFVRLMKSQAEESAKKWNKIVQIFDEGAADIRLSQFYSDFSEAITDKVLPMMQDAVLDVMTNTEQGRKWL